MRSWPSVFAKREFAGYWEYLLDEALFTSPAHPQWGGAALVGSDGRLLGIGSLFVQEAVDGNTVQGNMFVPIDLLEPILEDLLKFGRSARAGAAVARACTRRRPKGGWSSAAWRAARRRRLRACGWATWCSKSAASARPGWPTCLRKTWGVGAAGVDVPLTLARDSEVMHVRVRSADRHDFLRKPQLQ